MTDFSKNEAFLRSLYKGETFERHGFICVPQFDTLITHPDYDYTISDKPIENWVPHVVENYKKQVAFAEAVGDDTVPFTFMLTGTHIFPAAFGCEVHSFENDKPCAKPLVFSAEEADKLEIPDIWKTPVLNRIFELARLVQKELGDDVYIGPPDLQTGFDAASLIWNKTDFLCALIDPNEQPAAKRLAAKCARLFKTFLTEYRKEFPKAIPSHYPEVWAPPEMGPWMSNDECGAMNPDMFEQLALPEILDLSETFGSVGMHCCADAEHQWKNFNKIPNFYAFNRGPAGMKVLLDNFSGYSSPVYVMGSYSEAISPELEYFFDNAPEGTRAIIVNHGLNVDESKIWLDKMKTRSVQTV
jgi:hypothetical protein